MIRVKAGGVRNRGALVALVWLVGTAAWARTPAAAQPVRAERRVFVLGEFGWNSLAGLGVNAGYHLLPHLTAEAGLGFSLLRLKAGARLRANLMKGAWTPFVAAGALIGAGEGTEQDFNLGGPAFSYRLRPSPFAQVVAGVDFTGADGVTFLASAGWAFLLGENVEVTGGAPSAAQLGWMRTAFGSGPVVSLAVGYTF